MLVALYEIDTRLVVESVGRMRVSCFKHVNVTWVLYSALM